MMRFARVAFGFLLWSAAAAAQQFVISTYAGGVPILPTPTAAVNVAIGSPQAVATDAVGNVYFTGLNCVFKMDQNGVLTRVAGTGVSGYSGDGGPATSAQFVGPTALALDNAGNLYIADGLSGRVRKVGPSGIITTVAGNGPSFYNNGVGDGGPATSAPLFYPWQLAVDSAGGLYIGEWNTPRVRKVSSDGIITTVVGNGTGGYSGDGGPATSAAVGAAWGLAFDIAGNLYISDDIPGDDYSPDAVRIRRVSPDGIITTVAGTGAPGESPDTGDGGPATEAQLSVAASLAVDTAGNLYVSDYWRIRKVSTDGIITTIAGNSDCGYSGDGGPAVSAKLACSFYGPGLAADRAGNLYIADSGNNRVRKVSPTGIITTVAGNGNPACCYSGDGGPATSAQLYAPVGVAADSSVGLYIADTFNNRLRKVSPAGIITTVAGNGTRGDPGDGGPAIDARLAWPAGLVLDSSGNLYIADSGNARVRMISPAGIITTVAGNGTCCGFSGDGGPATSAQLAWPKDLALDGSGNLFIADTVNNRVRVVSPAGIITTVAGKGDASYAGDGGPAISAMLNQPSGVATDNGGNLYIADTNNFRVRKVSSNGIITTIAGNGVRGYSGDGGSGTSAQLVYPVGLKVDTAGNLYVADGTGVRVVSPAGIITTVAGNGALGYSGDGGPARSAQTGAWDLAFDGAGNLYVADPWNNAIRLLKPVISPAQ
jgi:sugar lactone lactonase YvrE